jgi:hypothetical protein
MGAARIVRQRAAAVPSSFETLAALAPLDEEKEIGARA